MGLYERLILPRLIDLACGTGPIEKEREKILPRARGRVLELGIGSGKNLAWYDPARVEMVWGVDPSVELYRMAAKQAAEMSFPVRFFVRPADAGSLPLDDGAVDTVVVTYALCTIADPVAALSEARRLLKADGQLLFAEHGRAVDPAVRRWQERITPLWRRVAGGCRLDRDIPAILGAAGFRIGELETRFLPGWRPASWNYCGVAVPA